MLRQAFYVLVELSVRGCELTFVPAQHWSGRGFTADFVVGSSVGAINAAHFAGDPTPDGVAWLEAIRRGLRRADIFPFPTLRNVMKLIASGGHVIDSVMLGKLLDRHPGS